MRKISQMWWSSEGFVLYYSFPRMRWVGEAFGIPPSPSLLTNRSETIAIHSPRYSAASFLCWFEKAKAFELHAHVVFCAAAFLPVRPLSLSPSPSHSLPLSLPALKRQFRKCAKHVRWFKPRRVASTLHRMGERVCTDRGAAAWGNRGLD